MLPKHIIPRLTASKLVRRVARANVNNALHSHNKSDGTQKLLNNLYTKICNQKFKELQEKDAQNKLKNNPSKDFR